MTSPESFQNRELLTTFRVPELSREQLDLFTRESIRANPVGYFDPVEAQESLNQQNGKEVIAVDLGGDKIAATSFLVVNGKLQPKDNLKSLQSTGGKDYLNFLEQVSHQAERNNTPVGISFAGPLEGTRPLAGPNIPILINELNDRYNGDFSNLFPTLKSLSNDAVSGITAATVEAKRQLPETNEVIYLINGSGVGGSVFSKREIFATEVGHVPVIDSLNPYGQDKPCGLFGAQYVCIESVASSKAGIEDIWNEQTENHLDGRGISYLYLSGLAKARYLYDNSATLTAHTIKGIANVFDLLKQPGGTTIVGHGGTFNVPGYGERVKQILQKDLGYQPSFLLTKNFSQNACLDGAAISALMPK
jgi:predicted NBD/HSP70 family sugar kinase